MNRKMNGDGNKIRCELGWIFLLINYGWMKERWDYSLQEHEKLTNTLY